MTGRDQHFNVEVRTEFIKHMLGKFTHHRYDKAFIRDVSDFRYEVEVTYDPTKMAHQVHLRSARGFTLSILVAKDGMFDVRDNDDWLMYSMQRMEPMVDTLMFVEWFYHHLNQEDRDVFQRHLAGQIKRVTYIPPRMYKQDMYRMQRDDYDSTRITPEWLAKVEFVNGGVRREILRNIAEDQGTWLSMILMIVDNRELGIGADTRG